MSKKFLVDNQILETDSLAWINHITISEIKYMIFFQKFYIKMFEDETYLTEYITYM